MDMISIVDTLWVLLAAILVFFMNLGFASVEAGFARAKNTVNILSKNFIVFAVSSLGFMLLGWGLMFGGDNPFVGTQHLFVLGGQDLSFYDGTLTSTVPFWGKFFFQLVFCGTAATIVSGAVAERIKYVSFILFSFVLTLVIYPIVGHWIWGGGWLAQMGFMDFAGDAAVHSVGGWAALAGAMLLGPRIGKYDKDGRAQAIPGHNMSLAVIGLFVLWLGWFGFNPGSTMSFQHPADVMHILVTTNTSAIAAVLTATITSWVVVGKPDLGMTINGCLAGLVGVTGSCAYVSIESSLIIGAIAGVLVVFAVGFFDKLHVDDPVGATAVHLCCGVFGTLCVGIFAEEGVTTLATRSGLLFGGGAELLGIQVIGVLAVGVFTFVTSGLVWLALKYTVGIRVSPEEELAGLDIGEELRQRPLVGLPVVVGLHVGIVDAERLPAVVARSPVVGDPVERLIERMQVLRHARDDLVGLLVLVVEVAGIRGQLLRKDVEARQLDVPVAGRIETRAHLVDIPLVGRDAVLVVREVELLAVHLAPVDRRRGGVAVLQEVDRVGKHHHHLALRGGRTQPFGSCGNGLFEGIDAAVGTEPVVDQVVPLLAVGRVARIAQHADHVGVIDPSGNIRILRLEEKEAVEEPVLPARLVGVAHQRREAIRLPEVGRAVVASSVAQHGVGGAVGRSGALRACTFGQPGRPRHGKKDSCGKERQACGKKSLSDVHVVRSGHSRDPVVSPCRITTGSFGLNVHAAGSECFAPDVSQLAASAG